MNTKKNIRAILSLAVLLALALVAVASAQTDEESIAKMEEARRALNKARYEHAAQLYSEAFEMAKQKELAGNALYWEAFARYRLQKTAELERAAELLELQQRQYEMAETAAEGEALAARIDGELARRGDAGAAYEVHRRVDEEDMRAETQMAALHALMNMDPEKAMPILKKIVTGEKPVSDELRRNAIFMLCSEGGDDATDLLIGLLHETTDEEMLSELVMCLSMTESERALDAIFELFQRTNDPGVGEHALHAIGNHGGDRAFRILADIVTDTNMDSDLRRQAMYALSQVGRDEDVAQIAADILKSSNDNEMLETALYTLSHLDTDLPDKIFMDLIYNENAREELRAQALFFAAQREELDLTFLLQAYDRFDSRDMKLQICHVITQMDDEEAALDALINIARQEKDPEIRKNAVFWVGQFDNEKAAEFLLEIINE